MTKRAEVHPRFLEEGKAHVDEEKVSGDLETNLGWLKRYLGYKETFDLLVREFDIGERKAAVVCIDSFVSGTELTLIMETFLGTEKTASNAASLTEMMSRHVPYVDVSTEKDLVKTADQVMSGPVAVLVDGIDEAIIVDVRKYPDRKPSQPSLERTLRGPHDGFIETLIFNTIMIRRRLRDPNLRIEIHEVGRRSRSDVALIFIKDVANDFFVQKVRKRIQAIDVDALTMSEKAIQEWIVKTEWWNPFPVTKFTERPDVAAEHLTEGHVLVMIDTSPNALILPVTLFSFLQSVEEYHEDVIPGSYLKWVRLLGMLFAWVGPGLWLTLVMNHVRLGGGWDILVHPTVTSIPVFWQMAAAEVGVDLLRLALIFAPDPLGQSMGFFGAVLLGSVAIKAKLLDAEVMIYVVIAAVGTFTSPDIDFGMTLRLLRAFLLIMIGLGSLAGVSWAGFALGVLVPIAILAKTRPFEASYLWPLKPFSGSFLLAQLMRKPLTEKVMRPPLTMPHDPTHRRPPER